MLPTQRVALVLQRRTTNTCLPYTPHKPSATILFFYKSLTFNIIPTQTTQPSNNLKSIKSNLPPYFATFSAVNVNATNFNSFFVFFFC